MFDILCIGFFPPRNSGAAITNYDICARLKKDYRLIAYMPKNEEVERNSSSKNIYPIYELNTELPRASMLIKLSDIESIKKKYSNELIKIVNEHQPKNIFIMHESFLWFMEENLFQYHVNYILLCHGSPLTQINERYKGLEKNYFINKLKNFNSILTVSNNLRNIVVDFGINPLNVSSIELGLNISIINKLFNKKRQLTQNRWSFIHVSNFKPIKNASLFFKLSEMMEDNKEFIFTAVGCNTKRFLPGVKIYPWLPYEKALYEIQKADFLIMFSAYEGLSRVVREAQLLGTIPIVPESKVFSESVKHMETGLIYNSYELDYLYDFLLESCTKIEELGKSLIKNRKCLLEKYNIEKSYKIIYNMIEK